MGTKTHQEKAACAVKILVGRVEMADGDLRSRLHGLGLLLVAFIRSHLRQRLSDSNRSENEVTHSISNGKQAMQGMSSLSRGIHLPYTVSRTQYA